MRDPDYIPWSDTFTYRVKYQESRNPSTNHGACSKSSVPDTVIKIVNGDDLLDHSESGSLLGTADCEVMLFSSRNLTSLRSLAPNSLVILLTPVLAPAHANHVNRESKTTDPFESFGRELSKLHHRLRHVPYVPKVGMTDTHIAFIEQAAAVVVVICKPADSDKESLPLQQSFAEEVLGRREELADEDEKPFVLVRFDSTGSDTDDEYSNVLHAPALSKQSATKAAQLLFKTET
jgi:hypothetical protein